MSYENQSSQIYRIRGLSKNVHLNEKFDNISDQ